jgi:GAF domain-containing protein
MSDSLPFLLLPPSPLTPELLERVRASLAELPAYHDAFEDQYVLFESEDERRDAVDAYVRTTTPTFEGETRVQLRPQRVEVHLGVEPGARSHLATWIPWLLEQGPLQIERGKTPVSAEALLQAISAP